MVLKSRSSVVLQIFGKYTLALITRRKVNWLHVGSIPVLTTKEEKKGEDASKYLDGMFNLIENRMHHTAHTNATASLKIAPTV